MTLLTTRCEVGFGQADSNAPVRRELGFSTNILFPGIFQAANSPFSIMYKKSKKENKAFRLGLASSINFNSFSGTLPANSNSTYAYTKNYSLSFSLGLEKRKNISQKWVRYYGGDIVPTYNQAETEQRNSTGITSDHTVKNTRIALRPFIGFRFDINSRLYLSTEFAVNLGYTRRVINNTGDGGILTDFYNLTSDNFNASLSPATSIFVFYRF